MDKTGENLRKTVIVEYLGEVQIALLSELIEDCGIAATLADKLLNELEREKLVFFFKRGKLPAVLDRSQPLSKEIFNIFKASDFARYFNRSQSWASNLLKGKKYTSELTLKDMGEISQQSAGILLDWIIDKRAVDPDGVPSIGGTRLEYWVTGEDVPVNFEKYSLKALTELTGIPFTTIWGWIRKGNAISEQNCRLIAVLTLCTPGEVLDKLSIMRESM